MANRYRYFSIDEWQKHTDEYKPGDIIQCPAGELDHIRQRTARQDDYVWIPLESSVAVLFSDWSDALVATFPPSPHSTMANLYQNVSTGFLPAEIGIQVVSGASTILAVGSAYVDSAWLTDGGQVARCATAPPILPGDVVLYQGEPADDWQILWMRDRISFAMQYSIDFYTEAYNASRMAAGQHQWSPSVCIGARVAHGSLALAQDSLHSFARIWTTGNGTVFRVDCVDPDEWSLHVHVSDAWNGSETVVVRDKPDDAVFMGVADAFHAEGDSIIVRYRGLYPWEAREIASGGQAR